MKNRISRMMLVMAAVAFFAAAGCAGSGGDAEKEAVAPAEDSVALAQAEVDAGIQLLSSGKTIESIEHFDKALKYDNTNSKAWCAKGSALRLEKKYEEAIENYNKAIELKPDYTVCLDNLGLAYMYLSDFEQALVSFNKALEVDPNYADAYFNMGTMYLEGLKDTEQAVKNFEKYVQYSRNPDKTREAKKILEAIKED